MEKFKIMNKAIESYKESPSVETLSQFIKAYGIYNGESHYEMLDTEKYYIPYREYVQNNYPDILEGYNFGPYDGIFDVAVEVENWFDLDKCSDKPSWEAEEELFCKAMFAYNLQDDVFNTLVKEV